ncbi:MAG: sulfite exporter TauE/SafE family protein [Gammaproteobacteria bacterium]
MNVATSLDLLVAFNLGLASQVHCVGMCGGIVAAFTLATAPARKRGRAPAGFALAYNLGRISSYALAGLVAGTLGGAALAALDQRAAYTALRWLAGLVLVMNGLALAGWLPRGLLFEALGVGLWRHVQKLGRRLLPISTLPRAWAFGMVWGWLPCALVYSTLLLAVSSGSPLRAAAIMAAFGCGTLPALVATYLLGARAGTLLQGRGARLAAAALLVVLGFAYPFVDRLMPGLHAGHAHHAGHMDHAAPDASSSSAAPAHDHAHHHSPSSP